MRLFWTFIGIVPPVLVLGWCVAGHPSSLQSVVLVSASVFWTHMIGFIDGHNCPVCKKSRN